MNEPSGTNGSDGLPEELSHIDRGLLNTSQIDLDRLARETAHLHELNERPWVGRLGGYFKLSGPGWIQSALNASGVFPRGRRERSLARNAARFSLPIGTSSAVSSSAPGLIANLRCPSSR